MDPLIINLEILYTTGDLGGWPMAQRVVLFSTKQKHTTNSGVEEESVLKECCKSSLENISP